MTFVYSKHTVEEMARRGIPRNLADDVLQNPEQMIIGAYHESTL